MYHCVREGEKKILDPFLGSYGWYKNWIYMRQVNRRKSNKWVITYIHERARKAELVTKEAKALTLNTIFNWRQKRASGCGLGLKRGGRQFAGRWKSECVVNKCWQCLLDTMRHKGDSFLGPAEFPNHTHSVFFADISGDSSIKEINPLSKLF